MPARLKLQTYTYNLTSSSSLGVTLALATIGTRPNPYLHVQRTLANVSNVTGGSEEQLNPVSEI